MREEFYILLIIMIIGYIKLKKDFRNEALDIYKKIKINDKYTSQQIEMLEKAIEQIWRRKWQKKQ